MSKPHSMMSLFRYSEKKAYGQSKLANLLHSNALSRRLQVTQTHDMDIHVDYCITINIIKIKMIWECRKKV